MTQKSSYPHLDYYEIKNTAINHLYQDFNRWAGKIDSQTEQNIALARLKFLDFLGSFTKEKLVAYPSLESIFEEKFVPFIKLNGIDFLQHAVLTKEEVFTNNDMFSLQLENDIALEVLNSYFDALPEWWNSVIQDHEQTQKELRENFKAELNLNESRCQCSECIHIYRTRLREAVFEKAQKRITKVVEQLHDDILVKKIDDISYTVHLLRRDFEKIIHSQRFKLKRSSLNKLEADLKGMFQKSFGVQSELSTVYQEKVKAYLNGIIVEENLGLQYLNEEDYNKFFKLLNTNIWRVSSFIRKEFLRYVQTVMALKRKDISSTILRDYLGQFWLHSSARKLRRKIIYHLGPTNSGKTYQAIQALCAVKKGCYLAPLRLLASELYDTMNQKGVVTTLLTGEEIIEKPGATHYASTIEMAKLHESFDSCVIDEIQMISDPQRGWAWTRALVNIVSPEVHVCGDGSALDLIKDILRLTGDDLEVKTYERMTELTVEDRSISMRELKKGDAVIVFSRRNALKYKAELEKMNFKVSVIYGMLSPEVRREQARKFDEGETDIIVSTDAIAMGMNLPVRRIVFTSFSKFIDGREHPLSMSEIKQISGRAGRFKRFPVGFVNCLVSEQNAQGISILRKALHGNLEQKIFAMVGPDLEIFKSVNAALEENKLRQLDLSEFLRLFHTMSFQKPFTCVQLQEMIELTEMVERVNENHLTLSLAEVFGFACAPVNLGLIDHVQFFVSIVVRFVQGKEINNEYIDARSTNIDYLETAIKCLELYQWLARHFDGKNFVYLQESLMKNKIEAIERLNELLSEKSSKYLFNMSDRFSFDREKKRVNRSFKPAVKTGDRPAFGEKSRHGNSARWKNRKRKKS